MRTTLAMMLAGLLAAGVWVLIEPGLGAPGQQTAAGGPALTAPAGQAAPGAANDRPRPPGDVDHARADAEHEAVR